MQTYYQCYWNKTSEENIRILRMFGESEEAVVPEMIAGRAVVEAGDYCFAVSEHLPAEYGCTVCIYDRGKNMAGDTGRWGGLEHTPCGT